MSPAEGCPESSVRGGASAPASTLTGGGFHFLPAKMHHAAETTEETIVQVDGTGPFDIHYLNPSDNPNPKAAAAAAAKKSAP